jgi:hypothetical protein
VYLRTAASTSLWKVAARWLTTVSTNAFARRAAPSEDVSSAVTATTSLASTTRASTARRSASRDRFRPRSARTASATIVLLINAAALAAAVRLTPLSHRRSMPVSAVSRSDTGVTRIWAVAS